MMEVKLDVRSEDTKGDGDEDEDDKCSNQVTPSSKQETVILLFSGSGEVTRGEMAFPLGSSPSVSSLESHSIKIAT
jgi:hypothetical protein